MGSTLSSWLDCLMNGLKVSFKCDAEGKVEEKRNNNNDIKIEYELRFSQHDMRMKNMIFYHNKMYNLQVFNTMNRSHDLLDFGQNLKHKTQQRSLHTYRFFLQCLRGV
ncbi:CLUMA_CG006748, isoform A [Clunio marinus]|uniref:CLUMA_CG006748, isoform A n=1 Tax=Clunio marinus TaxID=568069 RepID=A0A1J1I0U5_9DIPT|nr:CLUMA_CG006748, isoform A [Clunio marinus]